jgi:hypothetical protein
VIVQGGSFAGEFKCAFDGSLRKNLLILELLKTKETYDVDMVTAIDVQSFQVNFDIREVVLRLLKDLKLAGHTQRDTVGVPITSDSFSPAVTTNSEK